MRKFNFKDKKMKNFSIVAFIAFIFVGCSQPLAHYTIVSTNSVPVSGTAQSAYFSGESCVWRIFGIPTGSLSFRESDAVAKALQQAHEAGYKVNALSNVTIESSSWTAILFGKSCINARGQATIIGK